MKSWQVDDEIVFTRNKLSHIKRWWMDIDKVNFLLIIFLIIFGLIMTFSSSPSVAQKISVDKLHFIEKQLCFVLAAILIIILISFFDKQKIKIASIFGILTCLLLLILVLNFGSQAKGATRWITILGFNFQPSEFTKIFFLVFNAFLLQKLKDFNWSIKYGVSVFLYVIIASLLILQPDFGMTLMITILWAIQLFIFGLPKAFITVIGILGLAGGTIAYYKLPHVADRINKFLNFNQHNYQVERSIDAYVNGGLFGVGPGSGVVKEHIPDAHTDFIFAVVAEEFGLITCFSLMVVFLIITIRAIKRARVEEDLFSKLAVIGLSSQIILQTLINIGVSVGMMPTKGMTLPFISYGGSSLIAIAVGVGIILSLTKKRYNDKINYKNIVLG